MTTRLQGRLETRYSLETSPAERYEILGHLKPERDRNVTIVRRVKEPVFVAENYCFLFSLRIANKEVRPKRDCIAH